MQLNVKLDVPQRLERYLANSTPYVEKTVKEADKEALTLLKREISAAAPKGKSKKLSSTITIDLAKRKIFSPLVYARAVELGHYAEAKPGHYLQFKDIKGLRGGGYVYPLMHYRGAKGYESLKGQWYSGVRTKKQPFFFKTYYENKLEIMEIYDKAFKRLLESI
jgi:hypothetical protein